MIGIVLGAAYLLWLYQRVMFGPVTNPVNEHLPDLNMREYATLIPLVLLAFWIGIYPKPLFTVLDAPVRQIVEQVNPGYYNSATAQHWNEKPPVAAAVVAPAAAAMPRNANGAGNLTARKDKDKNEGRLMSAAAAILGAGSPSAPQPQIAATPENAAEKR